jgi:hypothetical protein
MMTAFRDTEPCSLVEVDDVLEVYAIIIALMMEAVSITETSLYFKETTRRYISEGCHLHIFRRNSLKSHDV